MMPNYIANTLTESEKEASLKEKFNGLYHRVKLLSLNKIFLKHLVLDQCEVIFKSFFKKNQLKDLQFFLTVLENTIRILQNPERSTEFTDALIEHARLADNATGAPSLGRKIGGILMMVVGLVAMFGGPIFALMVPFLLAQVLTLGAFVGIIVLFCGVGLFCSGTRRNLSKKMLALVDKGNELIPSDLEEYCRLPSNLSSNSLSPKLLNITEEKNQFFPSSSSFSLFYGKQPINLENQCVPLTCEVKCEPLSGLDVSGMLPTMFNVVNKKNNYPQLLGKTSRSAMPPGGLDFSMDECEKDELMPMHK
jgi:hypothetical protein